jgi:hypothetical protein
MAATTTALRLPPCGFSAADLVAAPPRPAPAAAPAKQPQPHRRLHAARAAALRRRLRTFFAAVPAAAPAVEVEPTCDALVLRLSPGRTALPGAAAPAKTGDPRERSIGAGTAGPGAGGNGSGSGSSAGSATGASSAAGAGGAAGAGSAARAGGVVLQGNVTLRNTAPDYYLDGGRPSGAELGRRGPGRARAIGLANGGCGGSHMGGATTVSHTHTHTHTPTHACARARARSRGRVGVPVEQQQRARGRARRVPFLRGRLRRHGGGTAVGDDLRVGGGAAARQDASHVRRRVQARGSPGTGARGAAGPLRAVAAARGGGGEQWRVPRPAPFALGPTACRLEHARSRAAPPRPPPAAAR